jgi:hypothetical protein
MVSGQRNSPEEGYPLRFNDGCKDFAELRALIVQARATAMNDADPGPPPRPRLDIEHDELVMA